MHDLKGFIPGIFDQSHLQYYYIHEQELDDELYQGSHIFEEVMSEVVYLVQRVLIHEDHKQLKLRVLEERNRFFEQKENTKKEAMQETCETKVPTHVLLNLKNKFSWGRNKENNLLLGINLLLSFRS